MKKLTALALALLLLTAPALATEPEDLTYWEPAVESGITMDNLGLSVPCAVLMEKETGTIIVEINSHERRAPASVTKIMSILLVVEALERGEISLEDTVTVSTFASQMGGSQIYLKEGERMGLEDVLKATVVASANDATVALAEHLCGSEGAFVAKMNERAAELGMRDTVFADCTGLPTEEEHLTTAYDVALMSRELIKHDMIKKYTTIWMDSVRGGVFGLTNTNRLVRFFSGTTGLKTGFTQQAGFCVSATAQKDGAEYIAVVMGAASSDLRFEAAKTMLSYAFSSYALADLTPDEVIRPIPVALGASPYIQPVINGETKLLLKKAQAQGLVKTLTLEEKLDAPVEAGQRVGTLTVKNAKGETVAELPLEAADASPRLGFFRIFAVLFRLLATGRK